MSDSRPLDPDNPYYTWSEYEGRLSIESECCADSFSESEERVLLAYLAQKYAGLDVAAMRNTAASKGRAEDIWLPQAVDTLNTIFDPNHKSGAQA